MRRLIDRAAEEGFDAALLFSEIGAEFYKRFGFEQVPMADVTLSVTEDSRRGAPAMLVRAGEDRDLTDVVAMDALRTSPFRWHLQRDRDLVHFAIARKRLLAGLAAPGVRELQFFVAEEGASAAAYVVIGVRAGTPPAWTIESCGDRDPAGARLGAILQTLIARDPAASRPTITGWLPHGFLPPQAHIVDRRASPEVMMIRPLTDAGPISISGDEIMFWKADAF